MANDKLVVASLSCSNKLTLIIPVKASSLLTTVTVSLLILCRGVGPDDSRSRCVPRRIFESRGAQSSHAYFSFCLNFSRD
jgi:hypothetical protein